MNDVEENKKKDAVEIIVKALKSFTTDFYKQVASGTQGNFVCSPIGVHTIMSMVAYGAGGTSAQSLRKCLHLPKNDDFVLQGFQRVMNHLDISYTIFKGPEKDVILKVANKIYTSTSITVLDEFQEIAGKYFHSKSDSIDFEKKDESAQLINNWCYEKTRGKIDKIVSADQFDELTMMVLINAVYFKSFWRYQFFESSTGIEPFHINKMNTINVAMMHKTSYYYYTQLKEISAHCLTIPYKTHGENFSMEIVVPYDVNGLEIIEKNFEKINRIKFDEQHYIRLSLPKFKVETVLNLKDHLSKMGLAEIFSEEANFKNMFDEFSLKAFKPIKVENILQKTIIDVNEKGTEAASITLMDLRGGAAPPPPIEFTADRPFLYKIMYNNYTLFIGRITNPLKN